MSLWLFVLLVIFSVALFVFYGQPIWRAPRESSHVMRFVVSYLSVIPAGALILVALRRFSWDRLVTTTGTSWAVKLVITALLYEAFARGTASQVIVAAPTKSAPSAIARGYQASDRDFPGGTIRGLFRGEAGAPAYAFVDAPPAGARAAGPEKIELRVSGMRFASPVLLVHDVDSLVVANDDAVLHTVRFVRDGKAAANEALPPGSAPRGITPPDPGVYELSCANHPAEHAWLVVVDHPYAAAVDASGRFALDRVPAGARRVVVVDAKGPTSISVEVPAHGAIDVSLDRDVQLPGATEQR